MTAGKIAPLTLLFPMAGHSAHASFKYKPFLELGDETAIQAAMRPFQKWRSALSNVVFVCLQEQEEEFQVSSRLRELFPDLQFQVICLAESTTGPAQTLAQAVEQAGITGRIIICDSDHSIDVDPLFERLEAEPTLDGAFPIWNLRGENLSSWSVAACAADGRVTAIAEKQLPKTIGDFVGVIGCYYFSDVTALARLIRERNFNYVSQAINDQIVAGRTIKGVRIARAEFFGDTQHLQKARAGREHFRGTIFCDLDGTLIEHEDHPSYDRALRLLPGSKEKLEEWAEKGYMIVLTTARPQTEQDQLEAALSTSGLSYHRLFMGLPPGPRCIINDRKPSAILVAQVASYEVSRNEGVTHISVPAAPPTVLKRFPGASLADTLLVEDDEKLFVRKRVLKRDHLATGYAKLKNQYRMLERFSLLGDITPAPYGDHDNSLEYYYDIEYLPKHRPLPHLTVEERGQALGQLLGFFRDRVYSVKSSTNCMGPDWLLAHFARKIFSKLDVMQGYPTLERVVNAPELCINGKTYPGLRSLLSAATTDRASRFFAPSWLSAVHGDLTFENILYSAGDVRIIDMDGGDFLDAPELDLGKMFQSLVARYEEWARSEMKLVEFLGDEEIALKPVLQPPEEQIKRLCLEHWSQILTCSQEQAYVKGLFYMSLHLIRMIPFRLRVSEEQALYALVTAHRFIGDAIAAV